MSQSSEFLRFNEQAASVTQKTRIISVIAIYTGLELGTIRWFRPWRQYTFSPASATIFNHRCCTEIAAYLIKMMDDWAEQRARNQKHGAPKFNEGLKAARRVNQRRAGDFRYLRNAHTVKRESK